VAHQLEFFCPTKVPLFLFSANSEITSGTPKFVGKIRARLLNNIMGFESGQYKFEKIKTSG